MKVIQFLGGALVGAGLVGGVVLLSAAKEDKVIVPPLSDNAAGDLVTRLLPLSRCAKGYLGVKYCDEYDVGVTVGPKGVRLRLKLPQREYDLLAPTLEQAVQGLSTPPSDLAAALEGWKP